MNERLKNRIKSEKETRLTQILGFVETFFKNGIIKFLLQKETETNLTLYHEKPTTSPAAIKVFLKNPTFLRYQTLNFSVKGAFVSFAEYFQ